MNKKILALLLSVVMVLSLASCIFDKNANETTDNNSTTETNNSTDINSALSLILDGNAECTVIRPDSSSNDSLTVKAAVNILNKINEIAEDTAAGIKTDYKKADQVYDSEKIEILVGLTGYDETKNVMSTLGYGDYIVKVEGNKVVVSGWMEGAVLRAADEFIAKIKDVANSETKTLEYNRSDVLSGVYNTIINQIPIFDGGILKSTYDCGNNATMAILSNGSVDAFNAYGEKAQAAGFEFYVKNILGENLYSSYITSKYQLNVFYTNYDKNVRIIIEPLTDTTLAGKESENAYNKVTESTITLAGLDYGATIKEDNSVSYQNGVCIIIRLEDNSFIVYDGGFNRAHDAAQIYSQMKEESGLSKPVIAAWIFSHTHGDHVGAFTYFSKNYASTVTVEKFILNRPAANSGSEAADGYSWASMEEGMNKFPNAEIIKAHPGQVYHIRNAKIEVLYTLELYAPEDLDYFNTSSLVLRVEISDFKMMLLGDISEDGSNILSRAYGNYLQSDLTTVSHHGYQGGTTQLYSYIKPVYVLWPMGAIHYERYKDAERSSYFFAANTTVKEIFVAKGDIYTLPIPYTGTGKIINNGK